MQHLRGDLGATTVGSPLLPLVDEREEGGPHSIPALLLLYQCSLALTPRSSFAGALASSGGADGEGARGSRSRSVAASGTSCAFSVSST